MRHNAVPAALLCVLACAGWYVGWSMKGTLGLAVAMVTLSPLIGIAISMVFAPVMSSSLATIKAAAYKDLEGKHYEYKGKPLLVMEDSAGDRWIQTSGVRRIVAGLPRDAVLARIAADSIRRSKGARGLFIQAQALDAYLRKNQDDAAIRFRNWLQREVVFPAERAKDRRPIVGPSGNHRS